VCNTVLPARARQARPQPHLHSWSGSSCTICGRCPVALPWPVHAEGGAVHSRRVCAHAGSAACEAGGRRGLLSLQPSGGQSLTAPLLLSQFTGWRDIDSRAPVGAERSTSLCTLPSLPVPLCGWPQSHSPRSDLHVRSTASNIAQARAGRGQGGRRGTLRAWAPSVAGTRRVVMGGVRWALCLWWMHRRSSRHEQ